MIDGRAIGDAIVKTIIVAAVGGLVVGCLAVWGLPKLWEFLKPLIHAATA